MTTSIDELHAWVAHPLAWAQPLERPTPRERHLAVRALVEAVVIQVSSPLLASAEGVPASVEAAFRAAAARPMADEAWFVLLEALERDTELEGQPRQEGAPLSSRLRALLADPMGSTTFDTLCQLAHAHAGPSQPPWCWVAERDTASGQALVRPLVGTAHPSLEARSLAPEVQAGQLVLWGADAAVPVPRWLATWDGRSRALRVFAGRSPDSGRPRYRGWQPDDVTERNQLPADAPAFLADLGWDTPAPAPRIADTFSAPQAVKATHHMAAERVAVPRKRPSVTPAPEEGRLILRVLSGRYVLRFAPLERRQPVVIGRNAQFATLVIHHHQISRAHTKVRVDAGGRVWVSDMGSTNGTQLNGVDVHGEVAADPGDVIGVGPVLLRLEHATADDEARLAAITRLEATPDRDPLTRLLLSKHLHEHLPEALRPSFREGGEVPEGAPALWGVLLHVDRLTALHAQHGEQVADGVFAVASRLLQYAHTDPMAVTKVGYGEVLVPLVGGDEADTRATTKRLIDTVTDHPWQEPVRKVSLTAAIGRKEPEESASAWLGRIRAALQQGRTQKGRGQIY